MSSLSEREVRKVWQYQLFDRNGLLTEEGEPIKIIYPGRSNDDQGADFRDAVIATNNGLVKGDIELHVKSSGWQEHRHCWDGAYNRVILHVVMWCNTEMVTNLQNGKEIPILAINKYMEIPVSQQSSLVFSTYVPCLEKTQRLSTGTIAGFLDKAGEERFLAKAAGFQADLVQIEAVQCLYQGIMDSLGYSKNKLPMLELARRLPLRILASIAKSEKSDDEYVAQLQALLLGTAGLLPSQCHSWCQERFDSHWIDKLERLWTAAHHTEAMSPEAWHMFRVRPSNSPVRRLVAMSYLLLRYRKEGILDGLVSLVKGVAVSHSQKLTEGLMVTIDGDCATHSGFAFDKTKCLALLGSGRASDMAVNVLLPFTFAWGQSTSQPELERKAFDLYCCYPKMALNSIERHMMGQLGLSNVLVNSAQRQQGLIHIYKTLCTQGRCENCSLSQLKVGNHIQV